MEQGPLPSNLLATKGWAGTKGNKKYSAPMRQDSDFIERECPAYRYLTPALPRVIQFHLLHFTALRQYLIFMINFNNIIYNNCKSVNTKTAPCDDGFEPVHQVRGEYQNKQSTVARPSG